MRNIYIFSVSIILGINYLHAASLNNSNVHYLGNQLTSRTLRQINVDECVLPTIPNGNINILKKKTSKKKNFLSVNVTCEYNYILQPPDDYLMSCFNGFWDVDETPQCKRCIKRSEHVYMNDDTSQLICPESLNEKRLFAHCGHRIDKTHQPFVVNGTLTKFAEFPWHIGIYKKDPIESQPVYHCGGSLITEKSILTVAHCLSDAYGKIIKTREYYAAAGKYHRTYDSDRQTTQNRKIVRIDLHNRYKGELTNYAWDIAVIIVDEPFEVSTIVHPVCIDWKSQFEDEHLSPDKYGEVAGWGKAETNLNAAAIELRVLKVPYINADQCNRRVPSTFIRYITPDKFCAGYTNGSSVCDGDSGGGLVFEKQINGETKYYLRGMVSVGLQNHGRCDDYKYSTYTKVSEYIPFIRECIQNKNISITASIVSAINLTRNTESPTEETVRCKTPNNEEAKCISIYDCKNFVTALKQSPTPEMLNFIKESVCGETDERKVCCGSIVNYLSVIHSNPIVTKPIVHENIKLLPKPGVCGRRTRVRQGRIYNENVAEILDHPWIVMLEFGTPANSAGYLCAGALINERYVLTAAHCAARTRIIDLGQLFRVRLGEYDLKSAVDCVNLTRGTGLLPNGRDCADPPLDVNIEKVIIHPGYINRRRTDDIALLRLAQKISFTDFIKPICLPLQGEKSIPGKQLVISELSTNEIEFSNTAKTNVFVSVMSDEECAKIYSRTGSVRIGDSSICFSNGNDKDVCRGGGYSGSPLMGTLANSSDVYVEGVVAFGSACGSILPFVATRVASYMNWILSSIQP